MSQQLVDAADVAIDLALKDTTVVKGTNEPSEVARLVNALPENLVHAWSGFVASGAMTVSAAFCHAKPRVAWISPLLGHSKPHEPELGDLLLVMDVQGKSGRSRRALLIQVKKSKTKGMQCTLTREDDLVQRHMYSEWPKFDVLGAQQNASQMPPQNVDISTPPASKNLQSRYAVVRSMGTTSPGWSLELATAPFSPPKPPTHMTFKSLGNVGLGTQQSLGKGLAELYSGAIGRDCNVADDWSNLVSYLEAYVWEHTASDDLPHVQAAVGANPSALTSATSYLAAPALQFVGYSGNRHVPFRQWMDPNLFQSGEGGGVFYRWPQYNHPSEPPATNFAPERGFGVIRIVVDQPLRIDER
jgi:hypothetical protein